MCYLYVFSKENLFSPAPSADVEPTNSPDEVASLVSDVVIALFVMGIGLLAYSASCGHNLGHLTALGKIPQPVYVSMMAGAGALLVIDVSLFALKNLSLLGPEDEEGFVEPEVEITWKTVFGCCLDGSSDDENPVTNPEKA